MDLLNSFRVLPKDLRLIFLSLFLWTFGLGLYNYVWSIYLRDLQASSEQVGIVYAIGFVAGALTMIPGAILANKYELKNLLLLGWILAIPPPLMFYLARSWLEIIPGYVLFQVSAFNLAALNAYISGTGDPRRISSAFGTVYSAAPLGIVVSPAVGSVLLNWFQIRDLFLFSFLFFTVSTLILYPIKRHPATKQDSGSPWLELPRSTLDFAILIFLAGGSAAFSLASSFLPLYFQDIFGLTKSQVQLLGSAQSLGQGLFAILLGRIAVARSQGGTMALGLVLAATGLLGIFMTGSLLILPLMVFLFGAGRAPGPVAYSILSNKGKGSSRAGKFGVYLTLDWLGFGSGSYLGGPLYSLNPVNILTVSSVSLLGLALLSVLAMRRVRSQPETTLQADSSASITIPTSRDQDDFDVTRYELGDCSKLLLPVD